MSNAPTDNAPDDTQAADIQRNRKDVIREGFKNKTRGEAWFNGFSYIGVGYGLVTTVSVFLTWLIRDTKGAFAQNFEKMAEGATKRFGMSRSIISIATLFVGGTLASVFPVKWLEDAKPKIVKKIDRLIYSDEEFNSQKIQDAHKELDELPKQTWLSVFGSRVVAFAATFGVYALMGSNKSPLAKATGHSLDEVSIKFGRGADRFFNKNNPEALAQIDQAVATNLARMKSTGPDALSGLETVRDAVNGDRTPSKVWSYVAIDAIYTLITSISLFISTRILGGLIGKEQDPKYPTHRMKPAPSAVASDRSTGHGYPDQEPPLSDTRPNTKLAHAVHLERVSQPAHAHEIST